MVALRQGVVPAANYFAKQMPGAVASAKKYVGRALGIQPDTVNLAQVAEKSGGMNTQIVAEAMVKAGLPVSKLWDHMPRNALSNADLIAYKAQLESIQGAEEAESNAKAMGSSVTVTAATAIAEKNASINACCRMLGITANDLWTLKVEMDHLHQDDVRNYFITGGDR